MADEKPPMIYCTLDSIEWTFLETCPDFDKMNEFMKKNKCKSISRNRQRPQMRSYCLLRTKHQCELRLLAVKATKHYHVYKYGEHNHPVIKQKSKQKSARGKQKSRQEKDEDEEGEVPMEEEQEDEDEPIEREQHPEDIAQPEQDEQIETDGEEYPLDLEKCQRRLQSNLHKYHMVRTKKWMRRIDQAEIGRIIAELDVRNVANLMSMADTDIGIFEETLPFWLPWMKKAIRNWRSELVEYIMEFKELLKVESLPDKLKGKIKKMLDQHRLEIDAQKMVPEETSSDDKN